MARTRNYTLPSGKKTKREDSFKAQWIKFLKPVYKTLGLTVGNFDSHEAEVYQPIRKSNGKSVPSSRLTLPHWLIYRVQCAFNRYQQRINLLEQSVINLRKQNRAYAQYFQELEGKLKEEQEAEQV